MKIETVLFDFDGTLVNSNELISRTHLAVLDKIFPGKYTMETVSAFNGPSLNEVYGKLVPHKEKELVAEYRRINMQLHDEMIHLFDQVKDECLRLKQAGVRLAIVSTKREEMIHRGLRVLDMEGIFEVVIGSDSYTYYKPNPEPVYRALAELNAPHKQAIMVGDNSHDIEAAKNAGIPSVWVSWSQKTFAEIEKYRPDHIVHTMSELTQWVLHKEDKQASKAKERKAI